MSVQVKHRRDTAANVAAFTGAQGELIVDTTNNRVTVHDGSTAGGWSAAKFADFPPTANRVINGGFNIWQWGTSTTVAGPSVAYVADQWLVSNATSVSATVSQVPTPSGFSVPNGPALNVSISGAAAGSSFALVQRFEAQNVQDLDSQPVAVSFDLSATTSAGTLQGTVYFQANTATDNGTWSNTLSGVNFSVPPGAGRLSVVLPAADTAGIKYGAQLCIQLAQAGATGSISATFGAVQLERGSIANPFAPKSIAHEIVDCERYFQKSYGIGHVSGTAGIPCLAHVVEAASNYPSITITFRSRMRAPATIYLYSPQTGTVGMIYDQTAATDIAAEVMAAVATGLTAAVNNVSVAAGHIITVHFSADARL